MPHSIPKIDTETTIFLCRLYNSSSVDITDLHPFHIETIFVRLGKTIDDRLSVRGRQEGVRGGGFKRFRTSESECVVPFGGDAQTKLHPCSYGNKSQGQIACDFLLACLAGSVHHCLSADVARFQVKPVMSHSYSQSAAFAALACYSPSSGVQSSARTFSAAGCSHSPGTGHLELL